MEHQSNIDKSKTNNHFSTLYHMSTQTPSVSKVHLKSHNHGSKSHSASRTAHLINRGSTGEDRSAAASRGRSRSLEERRRGVLRSLRDRSGGTGGLSRGSGGSSHRGLGGRLVGRVRVGNMLEVIDTLLDGIGDTRGEVVGDVLQVIRDLGDDSVGELESSALLLLQVVVGERSLAGINDLLLLVVEVRDGRLDLVLEVGDGLLQTQGVHGLQVVAALDLGGTGVDGVDEAVRGRLDGLRVAAVVVLDGGVQGADLVADAGEDAGDGGEVALNAGRAAGLDRGGGQDVGREGQSSEEGERELHCVGS